MSKAVTLFIALTVLGVALLSLKQAASSTQEMPQFDPAEMMKRAKAATTPGKNHEFLERFVGHWKVTQTVMMPGAPNAKSEATAEFEWLMPNRWLKQTIQSKPSGNPMMDMMMPTETFQIMGYDNYKRRFVAMAVDNKNTALYHFQGQIAYDTKNLIFYGEIDEPTLQESDKMAKGVWRFVSDDEMVFEIHDLAMGQNNTQVIEMKYQRVK